MVTFVTTVIAVAFLVSGNVVKFAFSGNKAVCFNNSDEVAFATTVDIVEAFPIGGNVVTFAFSGDKAGCFISEGRVGRVLFAIKGIYWI